MPAPFFMPSRIRAQALRIFMEWKKKAGPALLDGADPGTKVIFFAACGVALLLLILNIILTASMPSEPAARAVLANYTLASSGSSVKNKDSIADSIDDYLLFTQNVLDNSGSGVKAYVTLECGAPVELSAFVAEEKLAGAQFMSDQSVLTTAQLGYFPIEIMCGGKFYQSIMIVTDTIAPAITLRDMELWLGETLEPQDFVSSVYDATELTYAFTSKPKFNKTGEHEVTIKVTDMGGNVTSVTARLTVTEDTEPPVITGVADRTVYIGDTVQYKENIVVTDNRDGELEVTADIRAVNPNAEGSYTVTYTATDSTGLTATATATFTFMYSDESLQLMKLDELIQPVLDKLIKDDMTDRQKAKAIYNWVHDSINYSGTSDKSSWYACAIEGLTTKNGDCYTYFALSKALLTAVGIENVDVIRKDSSWHPLAKHYWNMVKIDGNWYHFDATPRSDGETFFLVTTKQLLKYSNSHLYSHDFDPEDYPQTP